MRYLSVIQTQTWLYEFVNRCEEQIGGNSHFIQCETICVPLVEAFPKINPEELQYELLNHGLFDSIDWVTLGNTVIEMELHNIWGIVDHEYKLIRDLWNGPKIPIFIFPVKKVNVELIDRFPTKSGVAYKGALFLFLSAEVPIEEIKALLAHEYNHVCRLNYLGLSPEKIPLKDSLIIEGLGEYAVKDLYGEKWLAPWTNLYSFNDTAEIWAKYFIPSLNLVGIGNHGHFLYGNDRNPFPKWIGYYIGFQIVDSFEKKNGPFNNYELYCKSSEELIAGSSYYL
ncbi:DUF2268 domain-containing protein [Paenisporosarcina sp. TG20]|uniref:DUF2268 domain-containing protein n=1 Tax=Paenisporosarcina sp. TG20 TaxID=1211706 RepID=UPI001ED8DA8B|nr:DUF2268 domain-containing putative Zn-dependent protease [Paenisporosarcina sp. TG20]